MRATQGREMTRENKLALVVGFGLLLFVGILVSDHLSAAQRREGNGLGLAQRGEERPMRAVSIAPLPVANALVSEAEATTLPQPPVPGAEVRPVSSRPTQEIVMGEPAHREVTVAASPRKQESEPGVRLHPVARGETITSICRAEYGDATLADALLRYNAKAIPDPRRIRAGTTIRIPGKDALRGNGRAVAVSPEVAIEAGDATLAREPATRSTAIDVIEGGSGAQTAYTVREGDTLSGIAGKLLGSRARWQEIAAANRDTLTDPAALRPGMILKVPARR
jgi:nucleoid-associated protein YgaU